MSQKTFEAIAEVEVYLEEWSDQELIDELRSRGYSLYKNPSLRINSSDWQTILEIIDQMPRNWETDRIREKVLRERHSIN